MTKQQRAKLVEQAKEYCFYRKENKRVNTPRVQMRPLKELANEERFKLIGMLDLLGCGLEHNLQDSILTLYLPNNKHIFIDYSGSIICEVVG